LRWNGSTNADRIAQGEVQKVKWRLHDLRALFADGAQTLTASVWGRRLFGRYWYLTAIALALLFAWAWSWLMYGPNGWRAYQQKKAESQRLQTEIQQLRRANDKLERRVEGLQSDLRVIEQEAINQGYVRRGTQVYVRPKTSPNTAGPQKQPGGLKALVPPGSGEPSERTEVRERRPSGRAAVVLTFLAMVTGLVVFRRLRRRRVVS
jgi:cell division protein FtsB